jgi:hypothetical protein
VSEMEAKIADNKSLQRRRYVLRMKKALIAVLLILSTGSAAWAEVIPTQLKSQADSLAGLIKDSYASEYGRNYYLVQADARVAVVLFGFEGFAQGNNWAQYMAVFSVLSSAEPGQPDYYSLLDVARIGASAWRSADFSQVAVTVDPKSREATISLPMKESVPGDSPNFPSRQSEVTYKIKLRQGERLRTNDSS